MKLKYLPYLFWLLGSIILLHIMFKMIDNLISQEDHRYRKSHSHKLASSLSIDAELLGIFRITGYRSVPEQCKPDPFYTSIGVHTNRYIVAISQDLLESGVLKYNDIIYIDGIGSRIVADAMGKTRHYVVPVRGKRLAVRLFIPQRRSIDVWCETFEQEKHLGISHRQVWIIHPCLKGYSSVPKETTKTKAS